MCNRFFLIVFLFAFGLVWVLLLFCLQNLKMLNEKTGITKILFGVVWFCFVGFFVLVFFNTEVYWVFSASQGRLYVHHTYSHMYIGRVTLIQWLVKTEKCDKYHLCQGFILWKLKVTVLKIFSFTSVLILIGKTALDLESIHLFVSSLTETHLW